MQGGLGVDRAAVDVDLEVEVATNRSGVAGLADRADALARPDVVTAMDASWSDQMGVEVAAVLALAVDQQVVAVEDRVIAGAQHAPRRRRRQGRTAGGDDVEAFMGAAAAARRSEFADGATRPVRPLDRKDMGEVRDCATATGDLGRGWSDEPCEQSEGEEERALQ